MLPMPADEALLHEQGLQLHVGAAQQPAGELGDRDRLIDGIEPELGELGDVVGQLVGHGDEHLAEGTGVDEPELPALGEGDHHVGVLDHRVLGLGPQELAAHAQVDDEHLTAVERRGGGTCPAGEPS